MNSSSPQWRQRSISMEVGRARCSFGSRSSGHHSVPLIVTGGTQKRLWPRLGILPAKDGAGRPMMNLSSGSIAASFARHPRAPIAQHQIEDRIQVVLQDRSVSSAALPAALVRHLHAGGHKGPAANRNGAVAVRSVSIPTSPNARPHGKLKASDMSDLLIGHRPERAATQAVLHVHTRETREEPERFPARQSNLSTLCSRLRSSALWTEQA